MNTTLLKKTLVALALGGLGLMSAGAQANDNRFGQGYSFPGHHAHANSHYDHSPRHAYVQSLEFSQKVNARQDRQMDRIREGMRSGALTRGEFRQLMREQHEIRAMERHFMADGILDMREFRRLDHALDMASRNIRFEKHDRQERYAYNHRPWYN